MNPKVLIELSRKVEDFRALADKERERLAFYRSQISKCAEMAAEYDSQADGYESVLRMAKGEW